MPPTTPDAPRFFITEHSPRRCHRGRGWRFSLDLMSTAPCSNPRRALSRNTLDDIGQLLNGDFLAAAAGPRVAWQLRDSTRRLGIDRT